jgi:hypothetical protein
MSDLVFSYPNSPELKHDEAEPADDSTNKTALGGDADKPADQQKPAPQNDDGLSPEIRAIREARKAEGWFGQNAQKVYAAAIDDSKGGDPKVNAAWREVMADIGASEPEARSFVDIANRELEGGIPSAEKISAWEKSAQDELNRVYGPKAKDALAAAMKFVARDPRLLQFLHVSGLGSHPAIVRFAVAKAYRR